MEKTSDNETSIINPDLENKQMIIKQNQSFHSRHNWPDLNYILDVLCKDHSNPFIIVAKLEGNTKQGGWTSFPWGWMNPCKIWRASRETDHSGGLHIWLLRAEHGLITQNWSIILYTYYLIGKKEEGKPLKACLIYTLGKTWYIDSCHVL